MAGIKKIAFIGIGNMGTPMASNLVKAGFEVNVYDTRAEVGRDFAHTHGCRVAETLAEAGRLADAVITMLPSDSIVREVLLGPDGLASTLAAGSIAIDMSTSNPHATLAIGAELERRGIAYVDAPVMGGVVFAKDATLDVMAGGRDDVIETCIPVFNALGKSVFRCGSLGSAHALKALANYINACTLTNVLEAMTIGRKFGLDTGIMATAFKSMCSGRQHPLEKKIIPQVLTRKFATGMTLGLIAKDLAIATSFAREIGAAAPLAQSVLDIWTQATKTVGKNADQTEIAKLWEEQSGVILKADEMG